MSVDELKRQAEGIVEIAEAAGAEVLVTTAYSHVMAYGASALYYDSPLVFYVPDNERRVWVYNELKNKTDQMMLVYSLPVDENVDLTLLQVEGTSVPAFFEDNYGITRGGDLIWGIR